MESSRFLRMPELTSTDRDERCFVFSFDDLDRMEGADPRLDNLIKGELHDLEINGSLLGFLRSRFEYPDAEDYSIAYVVPCPDFDFVPNVVSCLRFSRSADTLSVTCWNMRLSDDDYFRYTAPRVSELADEWVRFGGTVWKVSEASDGHLKGLDLRTGSCVDSREVESLVERVRDELIGRFVAHVLEDPGMDELDLEGYVEEMDGFDPVVCQVGQQLFEVDLYARAYGADDEDAEGDMEEVEDDCEVAPLYDRSAASHSLGLGWYHVDPGKVARVLNLSMLARLSVPYFHPSKSHVFVWFDPDGAQRHPDIEWPEVSVAQIPGSVMVMGSYVPDGAFALYFCFGAAQEDNFELDAPVEPEPLFGL